MDFLPNDDTSVAPSDRIPNLFFGFADGCYHFWDILLTEKSFHETFCCYCCLLVGPLANSCANPFRLYSCCTRNPNSLVGSSGFRSMFFHLFWGYANPFHFWNFLRSSFFGSSSYCAIFSLVLSGCLGTLFGNFSRDSLSCSDLCCNLVAAFLDGVWTAFSVVSLDCPQNLFLDKSKGCTIFLFSFLFVHFHLQGYVD